MSLDGRHRDHQLLGHTGRLSGPDQRQHFPLAFRQVIKRAVATRTADQNALHTPGKGYGILPGASLQAAVDLGIEQEHGLHDADSK